MSSYRNTAKSLKHHLDAMPLRNISLLTFSLNRTKNKTNKKYISENHGQGDIFSKVWSHFLNRYLYRQKEVQKYLIIITIIIV